MHCWGLRTGEIRLLRPAHVHLRDQSLDVVSAKGNRSRRLPLSSEVTEDADTAVGATTTDPTSDTKFLQVWIDGMGQRRHR